MNWWWPLFIILAFLWSIPMMLLKQVPWGWVASLCVGGLWVILSILTAPLYDWGTRLLRAWGLTRMSEMRERLKPRILLPVRVALLIAAGLSFVIPLL